MAGRKVRMVRRRFVVSSVVMLGRFFVMTRQAFLRLLDANPRVERKVLRALAKRIVSTSNDPSL